MKLCDSSDSCWFFLPKLEAIAASRMPHPAASDALADHDKRLQREKGRIIVVIINIKREKRERENSKTASKKIPRRE